MFFRLICALVLLSCIAAYKVSPNRGFMQMKWGQQLTKAVGTALLTATLAGPALVPTPVFADGATSESTIYRARNTYGVRIYDLAPAVEKGDFEAFQQSKIRNAFDLFISQTNPGSSKALTREAEIAIKEKIYDAVEKKDVQKLQEAFNEFVRVAKLKPDYKPEEKGQTTSSPFSPLRGTEREYIPH
eukprot:gene5409-5949_t